MNPDRPAIARIPRAFYDDREQRELPCPSIFKATARHYVIPTDAWCSKDFLDDAEHYAHRDGPTEISPGLRAAARATVRALTGGAK